VGGVGGVWGGVGGWGGGGGGCVMSRMKGTGVTLRAENRKSLSSMWEGGVQRRRADSVGGNRYLEERWSILAVRKNSAN